MITLRLPARVFLCTTPTDIRKSFDILPHLVTSSMASDPLAGDLFVCFRPMNSILDRPGTLDLYL